MIPMRFSRRRTLLGLAAIAASPAMPILAAPPIDAAKEFGLDTNASGSDQSAPLQKAMNAAAKTGRLLLLPGGGIDVSDVEFPTGLQMQGVPGQTILTSPGNKRLGHMSGAFDVGIDGVIFQANAPDEAAGVQGLIEIEDCRGVSFRRCGFYNNPGNGISAGGSDLLVEDCDFEGAETGAIHSQNGRDVTIRGNRIAGCGNVGIRIWRDDPDMDGAIITGNRISNIRSDDGGSGQNGNGVSIYKADDVVVSDNVISNCAFSAVRVNSGRNTQIRGNTCLGSGEVAIYSEFAFSGSVIADNIIDGASGGISMTNLDNEGHLATCTGNIVRNITPTSATNPEAKPFGIYAEADSVIANNAIENVPGPAISAGYGPFVRNVVITGNVISGARYGVAVSVVQDAKAGPVRISGNIIGAGTEHAMIGMEWEKIVSTDLVADVGRYPNIAIGDNTIG